MSTGLELIDRLTEVISKLLVKVEDIERALDASDERVDDMMRSIRVLEDKYDFLKDDIRELSSRIEASNELYCGNL